DGDVVLLRSGQVVEGGAPALRGDDPEVDLDAVAEHDHRLGLAARDDLGDRGHGGEALHDRRYDVGRGGAEDVDVGDGLAAPPRAAADLHGGHAGDVAEAVGDRARLGQPDRELDPGRLGAPV